MAETAIGIRSLGDARHCLRRLEELGSKRTMEVRAQIALAAGHCEEAAAVAEAAMEEHEGPLAPVVAAEAYACLGNLEKARSYSDRAAGETVRTLDGAWIDRIFRVRAQISYSEGNKDRTRDNLERAWQSAPDARRPSYEKMMEDLKAGRDPKF
ncbi:MAG: hypothetical protein ACOX8X_06695 [Methanomethylophilus sp.]|jgi:ATP/maltotriose-dependent transcriptional regulator MalT